MRVSSYQSAYGKVEQGQIGRPTILRSQTCDKHDPSGFFVEYAAWSGGVFVDMSVHDIDLTLWFFGNQILPKSISAHGCIAVQPGLAQHKDVDNAVGIVEFWGGQIAYYYCSRMMVSESLKPLWMYVLCKGSTVTDIVIARHTDKKTSPKLSAPKASSA
jgi:predicted dehydrogenase